MPMAALQKRMDDIRSRKRMQDALIDRQVAMVLLGLPYEKISALINIDPPPHPFRAPSKIVNPKRGRGRPKKGEEVVHTLTTMKRERGKPPAVATVAQVLDWTQALVNAGLLATLVGKWGKRDSHYGIDLTLAKVPWHLSHDLENVRTIIDGAIVGVPGVARALECEQPSQMALLSIETALVQFTWRDPGLQLAIARVYSDHLENHARHVLLRVEKRADETTNALLQSGTPEAIGQRDPFRI